MATHTRVQQQVLSNLRSILRHIRSHWDVRGSAAAAAVSAGSSPRPSSSASASASAAAPKDVSFFTSYVCAKYREGSAVKDRAQAKALRAAGAEYLEYLKSCQEQQVRET